MERAEGYLQGLEREEAGASGRVRLSRGGCFGCCDSAPNIVVRRYPASDTLPPVDQDRLTLTEEENETVYSEVGESGPLGVASILSAHIERDEVLKEATLAVLQEKKDAANPVAARIRKLREERAAKKR